MPNLERRNGLLISLGEVGLGIAVLATAIALARSRGEMSVNPVFAFTAEDGRSDRVIVLDPSNQWSEVMIPNRYLSEPQENPLANSFSDPIPSPNGQYMLTPVEYVDPATGDQYPQIFVTETKTGNHKLIYDGTKQSLQNTDIFYLAWSPDSTTLLFSLSYMGKVGQLYLMKPTGELVRRIDSELAIDLQELPASSVLGQTKLR